MFAIATPTDESKMVKGQQGTLAQNSVKTVVIESNLFKTRSWRAKTTKTDQVKWINNGERQ